LRRYPNPPIPVLFQSWSLAGDPARIRFLEFFAAAIRNPHTRRAYIRAATEFLAWCADAGVPTLAQVAPLHVATWIEAQMRVVSAPSVKQRLAAIRHLFDWLVVGQVVPVNPAMSVRGPQHIVKTGRDAGAGTGRGAGAARQHRRDDASRFT
jgi:site-specific recombinase XerC